MLLVAVGSMVETCLEVADRCAQQGIRVTVVDPRWVKPVPAEIVRLAAGVRAVVGRRGRPARRGQWRRGPGHARRRVPTPMRDFGVPLRFLDHAKRPEVLAEIGLTAQDIARDIVETVAAGQQSDDVRQTLSD